MAGIATLKDNVQFFLNFAASADGSQIVYPTLDDKIGNIVSIGDIGGETEEIDATTIDSLAKEYITGFEDNGTLELTQNLTGTEYAKMNRFKLFNRPVMWAIGVLDRSGEQVLGLLGQGYIKSIKLTGISVGGLLQVVTSIKLSGKITNYFDIPTE